MIFALTVMLFIPVYGEVFLYFGWTKLAFMATSVVIVTLIWSVSRIFLRRSD
jgi:hypothetical protein